MPQFPHLHFVKTISGSYRGRSEKIVSERTKGNRGDLATHTSDLKTRLDSIREDWKNRIEGSIDIDFPQGLVDTMPLFLEVDPECFNMALLHAWGIEVISEEEDGFIIAAAESSDISKLYDRLARAMNGEEAGLLGLASLWNIHDRPRSLESVVSKSFLNRWETLDNEAEVWADVSINIGMNMPGACPENADTRQRNAWLKSCIAYDEQSEERQNTLLQIIVSNGGVQESDFSSLGDESTCRIRIPGLGIKSIFLDHPHVWQIAEFDPIQDLEKTENTRYSQFDLELIPPPENASVVCVIDSGMQTGHRLLEPAIKKSTSYLVGDDSPADYMSNGGHGTKVGGAVLYPSFIPRNGPYQLVSWLQNARVLDADGYWHEKLFPPDIMQRIIDEHYPTRLYNMSICTRTAYPLVHMSAWAAKIDQLSFEKDVLFILCAGNLDKDYVAEDRIGLIQHLAAGTEYPEYLKYDTSRVGDPAQSCQAITVGSVCYEKIQTDTHRSFGEKDMPSAFSRAGLGIWNMIKPDVVEYGGDNVLTSENTLVEKEDACPELVSSTLTGNSPISKSSIGTSFAAPKVAHIAAVLQNLFPDSSTLLYRALIAQSARWPERAEKDIAENNLFHFRTLGYGIPNLERATDNNEARATLTAEDRLSAGNAKLYEVFIPGIGSPGDESEYRLEVTLSYAARPRRTRRLLRSYVSTRLQWQMAKVGESMESFQSRLKFTLEGDDQPENRAIDPITGEGINWQIGRRIDISTEGIRLQDNTLQKDWALLKGYELPEYSLLFAVTAHKGWDTAKEQVPYALVVTLTSLDGKEIYEKIEIANRIEVGDIEV